MEYEVLGTNILHFPRLLASPSSYIDFCINASEQSGTPWDAWLSNGDDVPHAYGELWSIFNQPVENDNDLKRSKLLKLYEDAVLLSCEYFLQYLKVDKTKITQAIDDVKLQRFKSIAVKRYFQGETLGPHPDIDLAIADEALYLTVSVYYNDDYEGGLLGFYDKSSVKPTPGSVVIFPARYLHESTEVVSGIKYVSNEVVKFELSLLETKVA